MDSSKLASVKRMKISPAPFLFLCFFRGGGGNGKGRAESVFIILKKLRNAIYCTNLSTQHTEIFNRYSILKWGNLTSALMRNDTHTCTTLISTCVTRDYEYFSFPPEGFRYPRFPFVILCGANSCERRVA